ncbi:MAG: 3-isopropylmalate dehydrogenase [Pseudomonadota bacterium]
MSRRIAILPGDGIGPEVVGPACEVLSAAARQAGEDWTLEIAPIGGAAIDETGVPLPRQTLSLCQRSDAILLGAVGGPKWADVPVAKRPEAGLLRLRSELEVFANLRPIRILPALAHQSPLRPDLLDKVDMLVVRELTGGIYFGKQEESDEAASDLCSYTAPEIRRVVRRAASFAQQRSGRLTLVDKANVLATSRLWRRVTQELIDQEFPDVDLSFEYVDAAAMHLITNPSRFDVIVTENLFGDILTDEASVLGGSLGMLPSASLGETSRGLYEPIHGSAPDIAGQNKANPFGAILSTAMLIRLSLGHDALATEVEQAVAKCVAAGECTADIGGSLGTREAGAAMLERFRPRRQAA